MRSEKPGVGARPRLLLTGPLERQLSDSTDDPGSSGAARTRAARQLTWLRWSQALMLSRPGDRQTAALSRGRRRGAPGRRRAALGGVLGAPALRREPRCPDPGEGAEGRAWTWGKGRPGLVAPALAHALTQSSTPCVHWGPVVSPLLSGPRQHCRAARQAPPLQQGGSCEQPRFRPAWSKLTEEARAGPGSSVAQPCVPRAGSGPVAES